MCDKSESHGIKLHFCIQVAFECNSQAVLYITVYIIEYITVCFA